MSTKTAFLAYAAENNIEIEDEPGYRCRRTGAKWPRHIHANAPTGYVFATTDTHNIGLWDEVGTPKWAEMIEDMRLIPCDDPDCESCSEG